MAALTVQETQSAPQTGDLPSTQDTLSSLLQMVNAIIAMEGAITTVLGQVAQYEQQIGISTATALKAEGDEIAQKIEQQIEAAEAEKSNNFWGSIFGWVATALVGVLSFGTLGVVAASIITTFQVMSQAGLFNSDSPVGKLLDQISGGNTALKDVLEVGVIAGVSIGAGIASDIAASGLNAGENLIAQSDEMAAENAVNGSFSGNGSSVRNLVAGNLLMTMNPLSDAFNATLGAALKKAGVSDETADVICQIVSTLVMAIVAIYLMKSAFTEEVASGATNSLSKEQTIFKGLVWANRIATLGQAGFGTATGVYMVKQSQAMDAEARPLANYQFLKAFFQLLQAQSDRTSSRMTQQMQEYQSLNSAFGELTAPLLAAAKVLG
jgi:hypothetical protein